jgi:colanic acid/amylovoran biosynthesis protein
MKNFIIISGLNLNDNNRGTAALSYGAFSFLKEREWLNEKQTILNIKFVKKIWKKTYRRDKCEIVNIDNVQWKIITKHVFILEKVLLLKFGLLLPFTTFGRSMRNVQRVAAINGGDGFSDIYNTRTFWGRLTDTYIAFKLNIPVIQLPQTFGPFNVKENYNIATYILKKSEHVFVRDDKFTNELQNMGIKYEITRDLSYYMKPQEWDIQVKEDSIGINVSGLAYSNNFRTLKGQFEQYPNLINQIICYFRDKGHTIYLIPHSYNYNNPEIDNDDIIACRDAYNRLSDKSNVVLIDKDLSSPQIKYLISKMKFFIGTRMHANFAAIYTGIPLFGLAYSYKFEGAFNANGLNGREQTALINNITNNDISSIIKKIEYVFNKLCK